MIQFLNAKSDSAKSVCVYFTSLTSLCTEWSFQQRTIMVVTIYSGALSDTMCHRIFRDQHNICSVPFLSPKESLSTTSGSGRMLCWLRPFCASHVSSWWRCPPWCTLPSVPGKVSHTCACVGAYCPDTLWSSISLRGSVVGCHWEGRAPGEGEYSQTSSWTCSDLVWASVQRIPIKRRPYLVYLFTPDIKIHPECV